MIKYYNCFVVGSAEVLGMLIISRRRCPFSVLQSQELGFNVICILILRFMQMLEFSAISIPMFGHMQMLVFNATSFNIERSLQNFVKRTSKNFLC